MARFYGSVQGSRGEAHRLGGASSGLRTCAASYSGSVKVTLYNNDGADWCRVELDTWQGSGKQQLLYAGPVDVREADKRVQWHLERLENRITRVRK